MHRIPPPRGETHLTLIGGGVMACAILERLVKSGLTTYLPHRKPRYSFSISTRRQEHALELSRRYPDAYITADNSDKKLWRFYDGNDAQSVPHIVLICTKPDQTHAVCQNMVAAHDTASARHGTLPIVVTMCPGITIPTLESWLTLSNGEGVFGVVRTMPNTPVSLRQGATALIASQRAAAVQLDRVVDLFRTVSPCVEILSDESLLNVAAAISGSGPAYILQFYESLVAAGVLNGLSEAVARSLVIQTSVGAGMLAKDQPDESLRSMIRNVCVPGGSTERGVKSLDDAGLQATVVKAVDASLAANRGMAGYKEVSRI